MPVQKPPIPGKPDRDPTKFASREPALARHSRARRALEGPKGRKCCRSAAQRTFRAMRLLPTGSSREAARACRASVTLCRAVERLLRDRERAPPPWHTSCNRAAAKGGRALPERSEDHSWRSTDESTSHCYALGPWVLGCRDRAAA